jgi:hypothetical protein
MDLPQVIQGREFSATELTEVTGLVREHPDWNRTRLSRELCTRWQWTDATGRLKDMACRTLLLKLERRGLLQLPARQGPSVNHRRGQCFQPVLHDQSPIEGPLEHLRPVELVRADRGYHRQVWETLLREQHYLGFSTRVGKSMCYLALDGQERPLGCLLFGAAAWKTAARDRFIGWTAEQRARNLHKVVNNMRFLIVPWVRVPHLASHLLGMAVRRVAADWPERYGHEVCLAETFVQCDRFAGTCYRAANWQCVGHTAGRSRNDVQHRLSVPTKAVYVYALCRKFREHLTE